jgi:magnesium-transporting ATPase (P-type)
LIGLKVWPSSLPLSSWYVFFSHYPNFCVLTSFPKVVVGSLNDWQKEKQFRALNDKKEERGVKVIRSGDERVIDVKDLLVGDIALLEPGEIVPCDGVFISGHNVRCDESGATGESDAIKKVAYDDCIALRELTRREGTDVHGFGVANARTDCFMVSGSKVLEGYGKYVVIAVGQKSFNGRIMMGTQLGSSPLIPRHWSHRPPRSSPRRPRSNSTAREAKRSGRTHRKDWWHRRFGSIHGSHDPILRPVGYRRSRAVSVPSFIAPCLSPDSVS